MPILNYTTKVSAAKSVAEIQAILGRKGASSVSTAYLAGRVTGIAFGLEVSGSAVHFQLPCNVSGVSEALKRQKSNLYRDTDQCERIAWRIVKDWVECQIALIEAGQAEMAEVFLPYAIHSSGQTMFQAMKSKQLQLGGGS